MNGHESPASPCTCWDCPYPTSTRLFDPARLAVAPFRRIAVARRDATRRAPSDVSRQLLAKLSRRLRAVEGDAAKEPGADGCIWLGRGVGLGGVGGRVGGWVGGCVCVFWGGVCSCAYFCGGVGSCKRVSWIEMSICIPFAENDRL